MSKPASAPSPAEAAQRREAGTPKLQTEFDFETFVQVQCLQSEDHREGVTAFKENRAAVFRGC